MLSSAAARNYLSITRVFVVTKAHRHLRRAIATRPCTGHSHDRSFQEGHTEIAMARWPRAMPRPNARMAKGHGLAASMAKGHHKRSRAKVITGIGRWRAWPRGKHGEALCLSCS